MACVRGSLVLKVTGSWLVCHEFETSAAVKTHHVEGLMHVKSVMAPTSLLRVVVRKIDSSSDVILVT
ncbi:hypothetical protein TNCV_1016551 [Trichonephila clavipes]|uniref:Uncharacterized protein n=1 Tax=Trichonephila clavipes TaxID=2585209 RepID=A0A8X6VY82_TRICX|nr:hypothetical protein TNCV_1016551 [Trichonephila clavipes]